MAASARRLALAASVLDVAGARIATRRGLVGEPLRITAPASIPPGVLLAGWGTALSAPFVIDVALGVVAPAADRGHPAALRTVRSLGWLRVVGMLSEPVTWGRRSPRWAMLIAAAHLALAAQLIRQEPSEARSGRRHR